MTTDRELIRDVSRKTLEQLAPQELGSLNAALKVFFNEPERALKPSRGSDDVLGFGVSADITPLLTPVTLLASTAAVAILREVGKGAVEVAKGVLQKQCEDLASQWLKPRLKGIYKRELDSAAVDSLHLLNADQFGELHEIVRDVALSLRVPMPLATRLADAVVGVLMERRRGS